jgi:hypothetical protein
MVKFNIEKIGEGYFIGQTGLLPITIDDESLAALDELYPTREVAQAVAAEIAEIIDEMDDEFGDDPAFQFGGSDSVWAER